MGKALFVLAFVTSCGGGKTCPGPWSSDPCTNGTVCEYSSPLACEAGCSGGSYSRWECINGKWEDTQHTAGAPACYCPPSAAQADASVDADAIDTAAALVDSPLGDP
jgi:hypothetical protein